MNVPRFCLPLALLVLCAPPLFPAVPVPAEATSITQVSGDAGQLEFSAGKLHVQVRLCQANMVKVTTLREGRPSVDTPSIARRDWPAVQASCDLQSDPLVLRTDKMQVRVSRATGRVSVYDAAGTFLIGEHDEQGVAQTWQHGVRFATRPGSHFYGLKGWEYLDDSRGQMEMLPSAQPYPIKSGSEGQTGGPLLWSNRGFGVFVNTESGQCHVRNDHDVRFYDLSSGSEAYYLMVGSAYDIQKSVVELTGKPPLFPKWALGFSNSEFADMNEELCAKNVEGYRSRGIPIDLYTYDFQWKAWGDDHYGELRWNPVNFPNGTSGAFRKRMDAAGIKLGGIMKPRIHLDSEQGRYATEHDFWVKGRAPYKDYFSGRLVNDLDFSLPECRKWFWAHAATAFDTGIVGWWNDEADAWGSTYEGMYMAQALYEGQREHTRDRVRVWTNNRNFFSGAQRYAYATWSGDIESGFGVMQQQRERLLCSVNVGQARWGMDTGGFNNNYRIEGEEANESFARWMEFAAFVPVFRTHGTSYRQPWLYGPKAEAAAKKAARLRYSLIPYMYAYERQLSETGAGLVRPLIWDYPEDPRFTNDVEAWMFGEYLLVAPIVERGQTTKYIALPQGEWIGFHRGDHVQGGALHPYAVDAKTWLDIPLFIKKGAIIPSMEVPNYVGEHPVTQIVVDVFASEKPSSFKYYDDDGMSYDYEQGHFFRQEIHACAKSGGTELELAAREGDYSSDLQWFLFKLHGFVSSSVSLNGKPLAKCENPTSVEKGGQESWASATDIYGPVVYVKLRAGQACKLRTAK